MLNGIPEDCKHQRCVNSIALFTLERKPFSEQKLVELECVDLV